jgi:hypothetical protein
MSNCHEMKKGEIYTCGDCGIELQVIKECSDAGEDACGCSDKGDSGGFTCCNKPLVKKS